MHFHREIFFDFRRVAQCTLYIAPYRSISRSLDFFFNQFLKAKHQGRVPIPVLSVLRTQNLSTQYVPIQSRRKEVYFKDPDAVLKMG